MAEALCTVAGDDLTFAVELTNEAGAFTFADGTEAALILHLPDGTDRTLAPTKTEGSRALFTLPGTLTGALFPDGQEGVLFFCVRLRFPDGGQQTPLHRVPLWIGRC